MIFDFSFKTGENFLQAYSPNHDTNIVAAYGGGLSLSSTLISGINQSRLSANGQTLAEQTAVIGDPDVIPPYYANSGDYYFRTGTTFRSVSFNENLNVDSLGAYSFIYDKKEDNTEIPVGTGVSSSERSDVLNSQFAARFGSFVGDFNSMDSFSYFINGQKIYSGISGSYHITGVGAEVEILDDISGKVFAIPDNSGVKNVTGAFADIYGDEFVEKTVFCYLNGLRLHPDNWIELHTGVTLVGTGLQSIIFDNAVGSTGISL